MPHPQGGTNCDGGEVLAGATNAPHKRGGVRRRDAAVLSGARPDRGCDSDS